MGARSQASAGPPPAPASLRWALEFLPHVFTDPPAAFHAELLADLENPQRRLIARVAPRGHAKSTCGAFAYPLWCLCEQKRRNLLIITHESSLATQFVRDIRRELESNERILARYGDLCREAPTAPCGAARTPKETRSSRPGARGGAAAGPRRRTRKHPAPPAAAASPRPRAPRLKWSEAKFTTASGVTVQAKGSGGSLRGVKVGANRPDLIICDDIEIDEQVASPRGRRKLEHWLQRVVIPALAPGGQLAVLGSLLHYDSLLANLRDPVRFPRWDYKVYRALEAEPDGAGQYRLRALWPARWPVQRLHEERERIGTLAFEQEYQANPVDDRLRVFRPQWLHRYDPRELEGRALLNLMAVDPATGVSGGDYFALWAGGVDAASGVIYTRELTLERISIVEQVQRIVAAFQRWRPLRIGIETVAYQVALKDILDEHGRRERLYLPVVALRTTANKRARIEGAAPFFENGTFRLPPTLAPEVEQQFLHFPKARHDDAPDVCAMAIELARGLRSLGPTDRPAPPRNPFVRPGGW